jgi:hypothetical protein
MYFIAVFIIDKQKPTLSNSIVTLESTIGKIYNYFGNSCNRQSKLKNWQHFLDMPELKFKRIFDIRWSSIRDCIKPIIVNVQPGTLCLMYLIYITFTKFFFHVESQALFGCLEEAMVDARLTRVERGHARNLLNSVLNDEFLYLLHMHHDLHESVIGEFIHIKQILIIINFSHFCHCVLFNVGPITKMMQNDQLSYFNLMKIIDEKKKILRSWTFESQSASGPALSEYLESTTTNSFGAFNIVKADREKLSKDCVAHISRLMNELDRRFPYSAVQEHLSILFDPNFLIEHKNDIVSNAYGRSSFDFLRKKYKNFPGFDINSVRNEWESLKTSLIDFINCTTADCSSKMFWKNFLLLKQSLNSEYRDHHKNILSLVYIYLISPTNSTECERGVC